MKPNLLAAAVRSSLRIASMTGSAFVMSTVVSNASAQNAADTSKTKDTQNLETIVVTGSNIRRVDIETASPVITISRTDIQRSGKATLGDLVQDLPTVSGNATNANVNNGGGAGQASISLRGLGSQRSLMLINGHRVPFVMQDLNMLPISAVERIEVLTDGASSVYGSDAIAGVVNIITRTNYQGAEFSTGYGISDHDDGAQQNYQFTLGHSTDKGSIVLGLNYNKRDPVFAANRAFSHDALYLTSGVFNAGGSARTPSGSISLPSNLAKSFGCSTATLKAGATGTSLGDYRCFNNATDLFNFQAAGNYDLTPSERTGMFALGNYKLTDSVEAYFEVFHNKTTANQEVAPLPLDAQQDVFVSSQSYYNPFGVDFGRDAAGNVYNELKLRLTALGYRSQYFTTTHDLVNTGLKGNLFGTDWQWSAGLSYGHFSQDSVQTGRINYSQLSDALGPSFLDPTTGAVVCGTPGNVIAGCVPINIFNQADPNTIAQMQKVQSAPFIHILYTMREADFGATGNLFDLPAGSIQAAAGVSYRKEYQNQTVDATIASSVLPNGNVICSLPQSACSSPTQGGFSVKEAYAELLVPILTEVPFARSLKLDIGDRYSKYNLFGSTNNWKVALEYRPIDDLLLRSTVSKVFRAPNITDVYKGPVADQPNATDPCVGLHGTNAACQYVPGDGSFANNGQGQVTSVDTGSNYINYPLKPEFGKSYDYGFVYDSHWLEGLSISADYYRVTLSNLILVPPGNNVTQFVLDTCYNTSLANGGGAGGPLCSLIKRIPNGPSQGQILVVYQPSLNAGRLDTKGVDLSARYKLPQTEFGNFALGLQASYLQSYNVNNGVFTQGVAGHYDSSFGNFARWRALGTVDWNRGDFSVHYQMRYIGPVTLGYANAGLGPTADGAGYEPPATPSIHAGAIVYQNISAGYTIAPWNTDVQVGIDNLGNRQPTVLGINNVTNANVDVNTYDTMGRYYWAKLTVKF